MREIIWQRALQNFQAQRFSETIADCERLIHGNPIWPMAFPLLSSAHLQLGQIRLATYYAVAATQHLDNLDWDGILRISTALILVGENRLAHNILLGIEKMEFEPGRACLHLGRQFSALEDIPRASAAFEAAFESGDKTAFTRLMYGLNCTHTGRIEDAKSAYETAIELEPTLAHAHWALAQLSTKENAARHIEHLRKVFTGVQLNAIDDAYVNYALYKHYERAGETELAWAALKNGAQSRRSFQSYDARAERRTFEALAFSSGGELPNAGDAEARGPIFIVGMPRTGTTLLERILGNHSDVIACGELQVFRQQMQWVIDRPLPLNLDEDSVKAFEKCNFSELGQRYLQKTAWLTGEHKHFIDKHPMNFVFCGAILKAIPNAKIINMQRNPMDSCLSNFKELFAGSYYPYSYDLADCASHYKNYRMLMQSWQKLYPGRILEVKYEDLVADPLCESKRIFDYLGLEHSNDLIQIENNRSISTTASSLQIREGIHSRNVDGWKVYSSHLSALQESLRYEIAAYNAP